MNVTAIRGFICMVSLVASTLGANWSAVCKGQELGAPYTVSIEGAKEKSLAGDLEAVSSAVELKDEPPATVDLLKRRVRADVPRFVDVLRSKGYHGAEVDVEIDESKDPVAVFFRVKPGSLYVLKSVRIEMQDGVKSKPKLPSPKELDLRMDEPARAKPIIDARGTLLKRMQTEGFALAKAPEPRVVVDHDTREVSVTYRVDPGPEAYFGKTRFTGLESVEDGVSS